MGSASDDDLIFPLPEDLDPAPYEEDAEDPYADADAGDGTDQAHEAEAAAATAELNPPQAEAVLRVDGPLVVFAGAGSGKTRVITYRIAHLVASLGVPPYRILSVTFTNKAAKEMKHRLEGLIGAEVVRDLWVGTFHATCARLLRTFPEAAGLSRSFTIYDDGDQRALVARILKELNLDDRRFTPKSVLGRIHEEKQEGRSAAEFEPKHFLEEPIGKAFTLYEQRLKEANAVDFDDLLTAVLRVAEDLQSPIGAQLRRKFQYILVDEFQDTNQVQYRLVRALAADSRNLCVVGDDDQSIYRWRGADIRNIRNFRRDFQDAAVIKLEQNYRSTSNVVHAALGVIRRASEREPKELWTSNPAGDPIGIVPTQNEHDEAAFVAERIQTLVAEGVSAGDIAVFYRIHAQSRVLEEVLRSERVPYQILGGTRFFERAEVKDFLSYLRLVTNPQSNVDLERIVNVPARKIGGTTIDKLAAVASQRRLCLLEAIPELVDTGSVTGVTKKNLIAFRELILSLGEASASNPPRVLAEEILRRTGYQQHLKEQDSAEADARLQNLQELLGSISEYEEEAENAGEVPSVSGYLERVSLSSVQDGLEDVPKVAMMTVHAAKGLEFDSVFLTGMEEEMFPFRGLDGGQPEELEEERRLAYVAITRARKRLFISHAETRSIFGRTRYGAPSRFLGDIPVQLTRPHLSPAFRSSGSARRSGGLSQRDFQGQSGGYGGASARSWAGRQGAGAPISGSFRGVAAAMAPTRAPAPARAPGERYVETDEHSQASEGMRVGGRVLHSKYGAGIIEGIDSGSDPIVTVRFSGWGQKRIKSTFLQPDT